MATKKIFEIGKVAHRADEEKKSRKSVSEVLIEWHFIYKQTNTHSKQKKIKPLLILVNRTKNSCIIQINFFILLLSEIIVAAYWFLRRIEFLISSCDERRSWGTLKKKKYEKMGIYFMAFYFLTQFSAIFTLLPWL